MIIGDFNDKYAKNRELYSFKAGVTLDLYLVKNKFSELILDDSWTLVDEGVEINPTYFSNGADVYHKIVEEGEIATINGSDIKNYKNTKSGANLIVAKRNLKADINIFSPNPSKELYPLSTNWYAASNIKGELNRHWYYKLLGEEVVDLGESFSGEFDLPYIEEDTTLELIVDIEAINPVDNSKTDIIRKSRFYTVNNMGGVILTEPVSGSQVIKNTNTPLIYKVNDVNGDEVDAEVTWISDNAEVTESNFYGLVTGLATLTSTLNIFEDSVKTSTTKLNIVDKYKTEIFDFGVNLVEEYKEHEDGRFYGFSSDYRPRVGETTYVDIPKGKYWSHDRITKGYIAFEKDDEFNYLVNNGLYRVKALLGPISRHDLAYINIEGEKTNIDKDRQSRYYTIETTANIIDNKLTVSGSNNLQLLEIEVERVNVPIDLTVVPIESYRVMSDMKWYLWNPDHYFPELNWYNGGKERHEDKKAKKEKGGKR